MVVVRRYEHWKVLQLSIYNSPGSIKLGKSFANFPAKSASQFTMGWQPHINIFIHKVSPFLAVNHVNKSLLQLGVGTVSTSTWALPYMVVAHGAYTCILACFQQLSGGHLLEYLPFCKLDNEASPVPRPNLHYMLNEWMNFTALLRMVQFKCSFLLNLCLKTRSSNMKCPMETPSYVCLHIIAHPGNINFT